MNHTEEYTGKWKSDLYGVRTVLCAERTRHAMPQTPSTPFPPTLTNVTGPCNGDPTFSNSWIAEQFGVISTTVLVPFKDIAGFENNVTGMSPQRAKDLGHGFFDAIKAISPMVPVNA